MDTNQIRFTIFLSIFLLLLVLESLTQRHPKVDSKINRLKTNLVMAGINIVAMRLVFGAAAVGAAQFAEGNGWGLFNYLDWTKWLEILAVVIFMDLMIYIQHILVHVIPLFWQFHIVHHTDLDLDVSSGLRFHPIEILGSMLFKIGLVIALGPSPLAVIIFEAILNGMALFSHSNIALPEKLDLMLRYIIVTPDMHRIHHSIEKMEANANFGFNLSIWDRFLGTYINDAKKEQSKIVIGVDQFRAGEELSFKNLLLIPFKKIPKDYSLFSGRD